MVGPATGEEVGPYRLGEPLGEGGMGQVYRATNREGQVVALKLLRPELASNPDQVRRFNREVRAARAVSHPHVVRLLDSGEHGRTVYLAQELIEGGSLADRLDEGGPLDPEETVILALHVASGLEAVHGAGIVHRDLKPGNILLDHEGRAYVNDFGLSRHRDASLLTKPGQAVGTLDYMAPEQIRAQDRDEITAAADVYALGCVMFECLTGAPPFADMKGMRVLWGHLQNDPPDPRSRRADIPADLGWALLQALHKEPKRRPPGATAYARMLQVAVSGTGPLRGGMS